MQELRIGDKKEKGGKNTKPIITSSHTLSPLKVKENLDLKIGLLESKFKACPHWHNFQCVLMPNYP